MSVGAFFGHTVIADTRHCAVRFRSKQGTASNVVPAWKERPADVERLPVITECRNAAVGGDEIRRLVIAPNRSMSWRQTVWFFVSIGAVTLGVASAFAALGLWMILPFAGLELLALGTCLYLVALRGDRREVVSVTSDQVKVEKGRIRRLGAAGGPETNEAVSRHWARVRCASVAGGPTRLLICASGRHIEVGEFLAEEEKQVLAERIRAIIVLRTEESGFERAR